jgi:hypothetical protein
MYTGSKSHADSILRKVKNSDLFPHLMVIPEAELKSIQLISAAGSSYLCHDEQGTGLLSPIKASTTSVIYATPISEVNTQSAVSLRGAPNATALTDEFGDNEEVGIQAANMLVPSYSVSDSKSGDGILIVIPAEDGSYHTFNDDETVGDLSFDAADVSDDSDDDEIVPHPLLHPMDEFFFTPVTDEERALLISELDKYSEEDSLFVIRNHGSPNVAIKIGNVRSIWTGNFAGTNTDLSYDAIDSQANLHNETETKLGNKNIEMGRFLFFPSMFFNKMLFREDGRNTPNNNSPRLFCNLTNRNPFLGYSYLLFAFASKPSKDNGFCFEKPYNRMRDDKETPKKARQNPPVWVVYVIFISSEDHSLHGTIYYATRSLSSYEKEHIALVKSDINQYLYNAYCGFGFEQSSYSMKDYDDVLINSNNMPSGLVMLNLLSIFPRVIRLRKCTFHDTDAILNSVEVICDNDSEEATMFRDRIAYELAIGKSIGLKDNKRIICEPNLRHYPLRSSIAGSLLGGSTLDMASKSMPGLQWIIWYSAFIYGMLGCLWVGAAAHVEILETVAKFNALGGRQLLFVSVELQYCHELKSNITKLFHLINPHTKQDSTSAAQRIISLSKLYYISILLANIEPFHLTFIHRKLTLSYGCFIFRHTDAI